MFGYLLMGIALYCSWVAHVTSWKIVIPLFILSYSLFWLAVAAAGSLIMLMNRRREGAESIFLGINGVLAALPCAYFLWGWANFVGPRVQYLLQFLLNPKF